MMSAAALPLLASNFSTASAYSFASSTDASDARVSSSWPGVFSASNSARREAGRGSDSPARTCPWPPLPICNNTASTASRLVPDISPTYRQSSGLLMLPSIAGHQGVTFGIAGHAIAAQQLNMVAVLCKHGVELLALGGAQCTGNGQVDGKRVHCLVVHPELVVQMRARGPASGAHVTDVIALPDFHALFYAFGKAFLVGVECRDVVVVLDDDGVAIAILPTGKFDDAVGSGVDGRSAGRGVINAIVLPPAAVHRVASATES